MKKLMILFAAVCGCMMAQAQTIDAIGVTQGETTDWYPFGKSSRIDVTFYEQGNPVIGGKIYDLSKGNVETAFGTDPLPAIREAAIEEVEQEAATAKEEIDGLGVDDNAKSDAKAQIDNIVSTARAYINEATDKDMINRAKTQAIADINNVVQTTRDMWVTVRTDGGAGNWNTICLERDITAIDGATFWTVSGQDATSFILDAVTEPKAGQGYLIRFTATKLKVKYGNQVAATPVTATSDNPVQGTFEQIDAAETNELVGNYVVYNNQLCPVKAWVGMRGHRAYVVANLVPNNAPAPAPGCARAYMPKPDQTPTELESVDGSQRTIRNGKFLRNGQLIIVKDNKMYNVQGMKL